MKPALLATIIALVALLLPAQARATDEFIVQCAYSHTLPDDPIVSPGQPGASHDHNFFGAQHADAFSTFQSLRNDTSTCGTPPGEDNAAYWMPSIWDGARRVVPKYTRIYYKRDAPSPVKVTSFPPGAKLLAGDKTRTTPSPGIVSFSCGAGTPGDSPASGQPPYPCVGQIGGDDSKDGSVFRVIFPHCWDGTGTNPSDFTGYGPTCPTGTQYVPRLRMGVHTFICDANGTIFTGTGTPGPGVITFGSYPGEIPWTGNHADAFLAWLQPVLDRLITERINTQPNSFGTFYGKKVGDPGAPSC